jgi:hypothetical protein
MISKLVYFSPITEIIILTYVFGYGLLIRKFLFKEDNLKNKINEICLFGFCATIPISQIYNFFFPLDNYFFYISYIFSITIIFLHKNELKLVKKWFLKLLLLFILLLPFKYVLKGNEDLYYHLPKVEFLTQFKIIFGIANINSSLSFPNGWAHVSSVFNFLNGAEKNLYLTSYVFYILSILTIYEYIKSSSSNNIKIILSIIILFIILRFNRLQEFGNDYQSQLLIFISLSLFLKYNFNKNINKQLINKIIFFSFFACMFRIYAIFILPMFILIVLREKRELFKIIKKRVFIFIFITLVSTSLTSFASSGCFYMPIEKTCIDKSKISWSYSSNIKGLNTHLKSFNTSYNEYTKINDLTREEWIQNYNWLKFHILSKAFYKPLIKTFAIILALSIIFGLKYKINISTINYNNLFLFLLSVCSVLLWLLNTPLFRAGGYAYFAFCLTTFLSVNFTFKKNFEIKNLRVLIFMFLILLNFINLSRLNKEVKKYDTSDPFFFTKWHNLNPAYYLSYINLSKALYSNKAQNQLDNNLILIKKNSYFYILENK